MNIRDDKEKYAYELIRSIKIDKLQQEKKEVIQKLQDENITEDEKRLLEERLNEIVTSLVRK